MSEPSRSDVWEKLTVKVGELALAAGFLEMAIIAIVCRILNKTEEELKISSNSAWCRKLLDVRPMTWSEDERNQLEFRIRHIRHLYSRRNKLIHAGLALVSDDSVHGVPPGSIIDLRTYGLGVTGRTPNSVTVGVVAKQVKLDEISSLARALHDARLSLVPYMDLADQIKHPADLSELSRFVREAEIGRKLF
jgi:hypothetical protein